MEGYAALRSCLYVMKNECPTCPVFAGHKEELGIMIRLVLEL